MFEIEKDNAKIGKHLEKLILAKYKSIRQFCKEYLELSRGNYDEKESDNMATRMSAIINGKKSIQFYDLPIFCELLEVSCEEIITAGQHYEPISGHVTNYEIAFSKDRNKWEKYINRPDKLILNSDEYCKTVIDYALEFKNYDFIKYLMDKNYIWFVDNSERDCTQQANGFGAGTSIKKRKIYEVDSLDAELMNPIKENRLRQKLIALAIEKEEFHMLDTLRAREIPTLYQACIYMRPPTTSKDYYDDTVIEEIVTHSKVIKYFAEDIDIKIKNQFDNPQMFIYPYIGKVLERLISIKSKKAETEYVIRRITEHNKMVCEKLQSSINATNEIPNFTPVFHFDFNDNEGFLFYMICGSKEHFAKFCANVIRTDMKSNDPTINELLNELKESYDSVKNILPNI